MLTSKLVANVFAESVCAEEGQEERRKHRDLNKQLLQFNVEQMCTQIVKVFAGQHGHDGKDHSGLQNPQGADK